MLGVPEVNKSEMKYTAKDYYDFVVNLLKTHEAPTMVPHNEDEEFLWRKLSDTFTD